MSNTCYFIGYVDTETMKVCGAQLASESAKTITAYIHHLPFDILEITRGSYSEARKEMLGILREYVKYPRYKTLIELLSVEDLDDLTDFETGVGILETPTSPKEG